MANPNDEYHEHDRSDIQHEEIDSFFQDCAEKEKLDMEDFLTNCDESEAEYWAAEKKQAGKVVRNNQEGRSSSS